MSLNAFLKIQADLEDQMPIFIGREGEVERFTNLFPTREFSMRTMISAVGMKVMLSERVPADQVWVVQGQWPFKRLAIIDLKGMEGEVKS